MLITVYDQKQRFKMSELNVISSDAAITEFFHACAYVCADVTYRLLKNDPNAEQATSARQRCYYTLDAFAKLAWFVVLYVSVL